MKFLSLNHVFKDYIPGFHAVSDFCLDIEREEFLVLVGPSGCGKSTTLRMIAGLEDITSGDIVLEGKKINDLHPKDRDISMVFQNYALYPHMTVRENLSFGLKMKKTDRKDIDERVTEAAKLLEIGDLLDRKPKELSGGQRQRVALGRAIVRKAALFLMDEPLSNLDAKLRAGTRAEIIKLHRKLKTTTIYVTHDQTEAMTMATRIVVMRDGFIQQAGTPEEIYKDPHNKFVAEFIGSPGMNFFNAKITDEGLNTGNEIIKISEAMIRSLEDKGYGGEEVTAGIRPEHFSYRRDGKVGTEEESFVLKVMPELSELTGAEVLLHFTLGDREAIARLDSETVISEGEIAELKYNPNKILFFTKETEERIYI